MPRRILLSLLILVLTATGAQAQSQRQSYRAERWEFSLQTRYFGGTSYDGSGGSKVQLADDLGWGFGFVYNLNQRFNVGALFSWRSVDYEATVVLEGTGENERYANQLTTSTVGLIGEWNVLQGPFTPYVSGGIGWLHLNTNVFAGWGSGCWWDPWWGYVCGAVPLTYGTDTGVYSLGVGGRFEVTDKVFLKAGYEFGWTGDDLVNDIGLIRVDFGLLI